MIQAVELTKQFNGTTAVDRVSFEVSEGRTLGLIGTSGCGKTTTLRMLNRLVEPTAGRVLIDGQNISQKSPEVLRRSIGYVIQNIGLFPHYNVEDNVAVVPRLLHQNETNIHKRCGELLELVGLPTEQYAKRYPHELSGGQQQRVGFARALAADPPVILLDEPFGGLDQITRAQIQRDFRKLNQQLGKTVVLVTHDVFEAVFLCDDLCLMNQGKVQQCGPPSELLFKPANTFVADFFQSQKLLASLHVVRVRDLLPFMTASLLKSPTDTGWKATLDTPLLELLQLQQDSMPEKFRFSVNDGDEENTYSANTQELLGAFEQVQAKIKTQENE